MSVHIFGIRHHGPGSARSLLGALEALSPDCVVIEGPPDAEGVLEFASHEQMTPPVALLVYRPDAPKDAVYFPFAVFSPEWQAIRFSLQRGLPIRFMDLPMKHHLAMRDEAAMATAEHLPEHDSAHEIRSDPLLALARAAGYADGERWWEHMVEQRADSTAIFEGITEAMTALREALGDGSSTADPRELRRGQLREAYMRKVIRAADRSHERVAVICGAWHVPALVDMPKASADNTLLKGLPKTKVAATWVPWTHGRLTLASGYGAGVKSPGWYSHLWTNADRVAVRWMTRVAHLLRAEGLDVSPAHIIDAVRLSNTLAAMRQRPLPGLEELNESTRAVLLSGEDLPMKLIEAKLIIGECLGKIPDETPSVPLQRDLRASQRRLRLKETAEVRELLLDLRKPNDLERSQLLRRLRVLGIEWGHGGERGQGKGTFKETWALRWEPELAVQVIEAAVWGNSVESAAVARALDAAVGADALPTLTALANEVMLAGLDAAVDGVMARLQAEAAIATDLTHLMDAVPQLAQLLRYGDVRKTEALTVAPILGGLLARICVGLVPACSGLNEEAAEDMFGHLEAVHTALRLVERSDWTTEWQSSLRELIDASGLQGILQGRCTRLLIDTGVLAPEEAASRFSMALSLASDPARAAGWIDGFLRGAGQILVYDEGLWQLVDGWVTGLSEDTVVPLLPVLRRTFGSFTAPERRQIAERVRSSKVRRLVEHDESVDHARARRTLPVLQRLLGLKGLS